MAAESPVESYLVQENAALQTLQEKFDMQLTSITALLEAAEDQTPFTKTEKQGKLRLQVQDILQIPPDSKVPDNLVFLYLKVNGQKVDLDRELKAKLNEQAKDRIRGHMRSLGNTPKIQAAFDQVFGCDRTSMSRKLVLYVGKESKFVVKQSKQTTTVHEQENFWDWFPRLVQEFESSSVFEHSQCTVAAGARRRQPATARSGRTLPGTPSVRRRPQPSTAVGLTSISAGTPITAFSRPLRSMQGGEEPSACTPLQFPQFDMAFSGSIPFTANMPLRLCETERHGPEHGAENAMDCN